MIPYSRQLIDNKDIDNIVKTLKSNFLTDGPQNLKFEDKIKKSIKVKYSISLNSASSALLAGCTALGLKKKDIFWTVPNSFVATANCGLLCGAKIDFIDIDYFTNNISIEKLKIKLFEAKKKKELPKLIIPVHLGGYPYAQKELWKLSKKYNFKIIEDASHAYGASYMGEKVGNCKWSDMTIFSFHPVKIFTTAEGGVITTNNREYYEKILLIKNNGITKNKKKFISKIIPDYYYEQHSLGYNFRMNELQSALGLSQLKKIKINHNKRVLLAKRYQEAFKKNLPDLILPDENLFQSSSHHLYIIKLGENFKVTRDQLMAWLKTKQILTNVHYIPIHLQPYFKKYGFKLGQFKNSELYGKNALSIPIFPSLKLKEQEKVIELIIKKLK